MTKNKAVIYSLLSLVLIALVYLFKQNKSLSNLPYPYKIQSSKSFKKDASIAILGSNFATELSPYLKKYLFKKRKEKVDFKSQRNLGMHRINNIVQSSNSFPKLIFLFVGFTEEVERRAPYKKIVSYFDELAKLKSSINRALYHAPGLNQMLFPTLKSPHLLKDLTLNTSNWSLKQRLLYQEQLIKIYEIELEDLIKRLSINGSRLVLITRPFSLKNKDIQSCFTLSKKQKRLKEKIYSFLSAGKFSQAESILDLLSLKVLHHSEILYLKALIQENKGRSIQAKQYYEMAHNYNCKPHSPKPLFNAIAKKVAQKRNISIFDLAQMDAGESLDAPNKVKGLNLNKKSFRSLVKTMKYFIEQSFER